jgi:16S rRNA (uracil1498-N3)-methyltransferase
VIRLFVSDDLKADAPIVPTRAQAHFLLGVMRLGVGDEVRLFNGRDGEWRARVVEASKRDCQLLAEARARRQTSGPDLDLLVALVKRARLETIVEKAAELGARRVRPLITERTNADRTNIARLAAIATEGAEQTGRMDVPEILEPQDLGGLLAAWSGERRLMFCDEGGEGAPVIQALGGAAGGAWAILIGPEGGFSAAERARIRAVPGALPVSLGPRILRADTAAIAAMALWQSVLGDWRPSEERGS